MEVNLGNHVEETLFTIITWVGIWGILEHVIRLCCRGVYTEIFAYSFLVLFGFYMLYTRGHFNDSS